MSDLPLWDETPDPGSDDAVAEGCNCPVLDNHHGQGSGWAKADGKPAFWIAVNCPLHADTATDLFTNGGK